MWVFKIAEKLKAFTIWWKASAMTTSSNIMSSFLTNKKKPLMLSWSSVDSMTSDSRSQEDLSLEIRF